MLITMNWLGSSDLEIEWFQFLSIIKPDAAYFGVLFCLY